MSVFFERLVDVCHNLLLGNDKLLHYLKDKRGLSSETIRSCKLGAFPVDLRVLFQHIDPGELKENNIIWAADRSPFQQYPIIIPVRDFMGNTIAIAGRTLLSEQKRKELGIPKYRNSNYTKTAHLYGLDKAKKAIRELNQVYVVEGYFDVITPHQAGIRNVVATCGTIFSLRQLIVLARYTDNVCLLFDNDEAGHMSANRLMQKLGDSEINLEYRFTPDGFKDLDELLRSGGEFAPFSKEVDFDNVEVSTLW